MLFEISIGAADVPAHDDRVPARFRMARVRHQLHVYFLRSGHDGEPVRPRDVSSLRRLEREGEKQEKQEGSHHGLYNPFHQYGSSFFLSFQRFAIH